MPPAKTQITDIMVLLDAVPPATPPQQPLNKPNDNKSLKISLVM